jgi:hypothetical protein
MQVNQDRSRSPMPLLCAQFKPVATLPASQCERRKALSHKAFHHGKPTRSVINRIVNAHECKQAYASRARISAGICCDQSQSHHATRIPWRANRDRRSMREKGAIAPISPTARQPRLGTAGWSPNSTSDFFASERRHCPSLARGLGPGLWGFQRRFFRYAVRPACAGSNPRRAPRYGPARPEMAYGLGGLGTAWPIPPHCPAHSVILYR